MRKVGRGALGLVFIGIGGFCALFAWEEYGFGHGMDLDAWLIAFGAPAFGATGAIVAHTGSPRAWPLGAVLLVAAIATAMACASFDHENRSMPDFIACAVAAFVLALCSVIALGRSDA